MKLFLWLVLNDRLSLLKLNYICSYSFIVVDYLYLQIYQGLGDGAELETALEKELLVLMLYKDLEMVLNQVKAWEKQPAHFPDEIKAIQRWC